MARRSSRWAAPTYGAAGLLFAGALGGLAVQVSSGSDPALGAPVAEASIPKPHYVVTRRVERRRVVIRRVRDLPPLPPKAVAVSAAAGVTAPTYSAPVSAPAPASSGGGASPAPVVAAAPAPAPAPAPVAAPVTRAS